MPPGAGFKAGVGIAVGLSTVGIVALAVLTGLAYKDAHRTLDGFR